jgi:hypothetical protein
MRRVSLVVLCAGLAGPAPSLAAGVPADARAAYARVLDRHVEDGRVDYVGLANEGRPDLEAYLDGVATAELPRDRNARIGFYVDAYNALVLKSILEHDRPRSVLDVDGFFDEAEHRVAQRKVTLDQLEKKLLDPHAEDPRTHFVLVCGAVSCPILESEPYAGTDMDARMERATRRYLASGFGAQVRDGALFLSKIFDWYAQDFGGPKGVLAFVRPRLPAPKRSKLPESPTVRFLDYNWTLNQR